VVSKATDCHQNIRFRADRYFMPLLCW